ncbi:MAG: hypothetical protein VYA34_06750 [Myxococcota bacterium]|nr:hypothetical protein [Myxococcota bacterium]
MSVRVGDGISTQLNLFSQEPQTSSKASQTPEIGSQVKAALFGKPKPTILDPAKFPQLAAQLRLLRRYKGKLAAMGGDQEEDYDICLAEGGIAMIDESGMIYVGAGFLEAYKMHPELLVGVLAHEIGHRPKRWDEYKTERELTREELEELCRHEETRADIFAGKALAEMDMECEPLCEFLLEVGGQPHPEYFPAEVRASVVRDAHEGRAYRSENRKKLFPEYDRMNAPKGHLGEY